METRRNNQTEGGGINGFFLGVILGAGMTLLFTTEKGKKIVKTLTEEGLEDLSKLQDMIDVLKDEDTALDVKEETAPKIAEKEPEVTKPSTRRFFKGIRKKS